MPAADTVPRSQLEELSEKCEILKRELRIKEDELRRLKSDSSIDIETQSIREELGLHFKELRSELAGFYNGAVVETKVEVEKLRQENDLLRDAEREVRRLKQMTLVNPHWKGRGFDVELDLCFILMPFGETWSDSVWKLVDAICSRAGLRCKRADEQEGRVVMDDLWEGLCKSRIVVADLTARNPNVTYEVGMADVLGKEVILLSQTPEDVPFDFLGLRLIPYENSIPGAQALEEKLIKRVESLA